MDVERALVTQIAQSGAINEAVAKGIEPAHFIDDQCRAVFDFCLDHTRKYSKPPSFATIRDSKAAEGFLFEPSTDAIDFVMDSFVGTVKRRVVLVAIEEIASYIDDPKADLLKTDEMVLEVAMRVAKSVPGSKAGSFRSMKQRIADHKAKKETGEWRGIQMNIPAFDELTKGVQPHEFVSVAGWQGTGKSTLLAYVSFAAYIQERTPMIFSLEMEAEAIYRKFDLMALNWEEDRTEMIDSLAIKGYEMTDDQMMKWEMLAERIGKAKNDIIVLDDVGSPTLERLHAEIARRKPDMVGVDYVSLMDAPGRASDSMWQDLTRLTKGLKLMARNLKVPIWGLAQTNIAGAADGARLENIAYSRSLGQDSDIVLGLHQSPEMKQNKQMTLRMLKNRDGAVTNTDMLWDPSRARFGEWRDHHLFESQPEVTT